MVRRGDDGALYQVACWLGSERPVSCSSGTSAPTGSTTRRRRLKIEIPFLPGARVELEHHRLGRYGVRRDEMWEVFDKTGDWGKLLAMFASIVEGAVK